MQGDLQEEVMITEFKIRGQVHKTSKPALLPAMIYRNNQFVASWVYTIGAVQASVIVRDEELITKPVSKMGRSFLTR